MFGDEISPGVFRTPDARFENLPAYDFQPNYVMIDGFRVHYVDEGDAAADPVLMLHGEPSWSFLYRKMIPPAAGAGNRVIAPDLVGFGRSDKPASSDTHTYAFHVAVVTRLVEELDLRNITLVAQDWGSLIGLRVAAENPDRFARILLANGGLPTGRGAAGPGFGNWLANVRRMNEAGDIPVGNIVGRNHGPEIVAAYDAPFPDARYKAGPLVMPLLVPITPDQPGAAENRAAWEILDNWQKPFLTAFSDGDPVTGGGDRIFQERVPGARGRITRPLPAPVIFCRKIKERNSPRFSFSSSKTISFLSRLSKNCREHACRYDHSSWAFLGQLSKNRQEHAENAASR